jgi:peptidoglycan/xylan/chitin deacetylase (PgdA/CDA1 family)
MNRHVVCLTFDFDVMSGFIARGMTTPTPLSRGEFGIVGASRILALLSRLGLRSTWFIPGHTLETYPKACEAVVAAGHEIAHHGWTHLPPAVLSRDEEEAEIVRANEAIKRLSGRNACGYRSPSWDLSNHTVELLLAHNFIYDSSLMGDDYTPYHARRGDICEPGKPFVFGSQTPLIEMPISWTLDDYPHFEFVRTSTSILPGLQSAKIVMENWRDEFLYMKKTVRGGVLTYTCHPFVIGRGYRMLAFENFVMGLVDDGATFLTMAEAVEEARPHIARATPQR